MNIENAKEKLNEQSIKIEKLKAEQSAETLEYIKLGEAYIKQREDLQHELKLLINKYRLALRQANYKTLKELENFFIESDMC